jgi:hypothetical protein
MLLHLVQAIRELAAVWDIGKKVAHDLYREGVSRSHAAFCRSLLWRFWESLADR